MPTARPQEVVLSKETSLFVNKGTTEAPNWIKVGCGTSKDYGFTKSILTANCDSGTIKVDSGEDPEFDLQFTGFVFEYASANVAANVSASEFEDWGIAGAMKEYRLSRPYTGDRVRTFNAYIASFRETGGNGEIRQYNIGLNFQQKPTMSVQA